MFSYLKLKSDNYSSEKIHYFCIKTADGLIFKNGSFILIWGRGETKENKIKKKGVSEPFQFL